MDINEWKVGNTTHKIYDARVSTGTGTPATAITTPTTYDIFLRTDEVKTLNGWNYIIHENNICECWAVMSASATCTQAFTGHYMGGVSLASGYTFNYPVTFASQPICFFNGASTTNNSAQDSFWLACWQNADNLGTTTKAPVPVMIRGTTGPSTAISFELYYYAIGTIATS